MTTGNGCDISWTFAQNIRLPIPGPIRGATIRRKVAVKESDYEATGAGGCYTHCIPSRTIKEAKSPLDF